MEKFFALGHSAHDAGKLRVPALDSLMHQELENTEVGTGAADKMQRWLNGWDAAYAAHHARAEALRYSAYRDETLP